MCNSGKLLLWLVMSYMPVLAMSQSGEYFVVDKVLYQGNRTTAEKVINNELNTLPGDTVWVAELNRTIEQNEKRLLSTGLFTLASLEVKNWKITEQKADILVAVQENWYIYPSFIFELADRNFNVWWTEQNRDFGRVNYGLSLDHINLTGHRDKLKVKLQRGYTHKYEANYSYPYVGKNWGMNGEIFYSTNKEIGYVTVGNKTIFRRATDERVLLRRFRTGLGANYRPTVYHFHTARLEYHHNSIDDIVANDYNPNYFLAGEQDLRFFLFRYDFTLDKRLFTLYPEGGYSLAASVVKEGLGVFDDFNNLSISLTAEQYYSLTDRWIVGGRVKGKVNLIRNTVAFANNTGLGYGDDLVRGYELYVVDGTDWLLAKTNVRWQLYNKLHQLGRYMVLPQLRQMPVRVYLRANIEAGYVNEPTYIATNTLNNRVLIGYGPALDIILWNTALASIEYSFNHLGESALFLTSAFSF